MLEEANVIGILTEALTAQVQVVLADQARALSANTATQKVISYIHTGSLPFTGAFAIVVGAGAPDVAVNHFLLVFLYFLLSTRWKNLTS